MRFPCRYSRHGKNEMGEAGMRRQRVFFSAMAALDKRVPGDPWQVGNALDSVPSQGEQNNEAAITEAVSLWTGSAHKSHDPTPRKRRQGAASADQQLCCPDGCRTARCLCIRVHIRGADTLFLRASVSTIPDAVSSSSTHRKKRAPLSG